MAAWLHVTSPQKCGYQYGLIVVLFIFYRCFCFSIILVDQARAQLIVGEQQCLPRGTASMRQRMKSSKYFPDRLTLCSIATS